MKFLADENFPYASAKLLKEAGHDVEHMGLFGAGSDDHHVIDPQSWQRATIDDLS